MFRCRDFGVEPIIQQTQEHRATVAVALPLLGTHAVLGHEHPAGLEYGFGTFRNLYRMPAHTAEQGVEIPLRGEERAERIVVFVHVLEILVVALLMCCPRSDLVQHGLRDGIVPVRIVAV